jgi:RNA polymerase sigma-70 factor (ECF subfamily)
MAAAAADSRDADAARARLARALERVAAGDRDALQSVYRDTSAKLYGLCLRILGEPSAAEDVLQEVYVTVWNKAGQFDPERASPITWLVTIARNRSIDTLRSRRPATAPAEAAADIPDPSPSAEAALQMSDEARRLRACLGELEPERAALIRAAFFEGSTYEALAHRVDAPIGTMKSWIRRSLLRLRGCLER